MVEQVDGRVTVVRPRPDASSEHAAPAILLGVGALALVVALWPGDRPAAVVAVLALLVVVAWWAVRRDHVRRSRVAVHGGRVSTVGLLRRRRELPLDRLSEVVWSEVWSPWRRRPDRRLYLIDDAGRRWWWAGARLWDPDELYRLAETMAGHGVSAVQHTGLSRPALHRRHPRAVTWLHLYPGAPVLLVVVLGVVVLALL